MDQKLFIINIYLIMSILSNIMPVSAQVPRAVSFEKMEGFPADEQGIEKGVSACFAGVVGDCLVMAGGCNFPDRPAAEGGSKHYYQGIYAARINTSNVLEWQRIGSLPVACAYGVSVQLSDGILCIGGNNLDASFKEVFKIGIADGQATIEEWPSLPCAMDNFTVVLCGRDVVVYDGSQLLKLNLDRLCEGWKTCEEVHGQKLGQPVSGCIDGDFCTWGGSTARTAEREAQLRLSGYRYGAKPTELKTPVDESGNPIFLGGAAAVNLSDSVVLAVGGVNKDIFLEAVNHPKPGYMTHPIAWYRFNPYVCIYDREGWHLIGRSDITARAGAALALHGNDVYLVGGELKPGIRTADIYRMTFTY